MVDTVIDNNKMVTVEAVSTESVAGKHALLDFYAGIILDQFTLRGMEDLRHQTTDLPSANDYQLVEKKLFIEQVHSKGMEIMETVDSHKQKLSETLLRKEVGGCMSEENSFKLRKRARSAK